MASRADRGFYLDASAIVKLVVWEEESDALSDYLGDARLVTSEIAAVEVPRAAYVRTDARTAVVQSERLLAGFHLLALDRDLRRAAARAEPPDLRALDALHLASVLRVRDWIDAVVAYDRRLSVAVTAAGLRVEAPGRPA